MQWDAGSRGVVGVVRQGDLKVGAAVAQGGAEDRDLVGGDREGGKEVTDVAFDSVDGSPDLGIARCPRAMGWRLRVRVAWRLEF